MHLNFRRVLASLAIACLAVIVAATPADARRKFGSGSKSSSLSAPARAPASAAKANLTGPLIGVALMRAARARLSKVFELPATDANRLEDGRHFHIGRLARSFFGGNYVGYVSATEYVELPSDKLQSLLFSVGFNSVAEFEEHLASQPPPKPDAPTAEETASEPAEAKESLGTLQTAALVAAVLALAGVLGFYVVSWRRNRAAGSPAPVQATTRLARVAAPAPRAPVVQSHSAVPPRPAAAPRVMPQPLPPVNRPSAPAIVPSRRAPRDLSALTRPKPA